MAILPRMCLISFWNNINNVLGDYSLWISEMNDSKVVRDWWEELGILL